MDEMKALRAELAHYKEEKEKIRDIVGQIGGKSHHRRDIFINVIFLLLVTTSFGFDFIQCVLGWRIPYLPHNLLLGVAVLLVSLKIIWMIHTQSKVDHFQFWILHSIEFQMNMLSRRIAALAKDISVLSEPGNHSDDGSDGSSDTPD